MAKFSEVLCIVNGKNQRKVENPNGKYPIYGSGGIMGYANDHLCDANTVVIGRKGSINNPIYVETPFWNVDTAFGLCSDVSKLYPKYLYYFCVNFDFEQLNTTVTIPSLTKSNLLNIEIPLPPLDEQRRIAAVLDKVSDLIAKRRAQLDKLDELVKAQFAEMFGDPERNPKHWPVLSMNQTCKVGSSKRIYKSEHTSNGIPFLRVSNLTDLINTGMSTPDLYIPEELYNELKNQGQVPTAGDILLTSRGTLGQCYIVKENDEFYFQDGMISWLSNFSDCITPLYLSYLFAMPGFRRQIESIQAGTTVSYLSISMINRLSVMLPTMELQISFSSFVKHTDGMKLTIQQSLDKLEMLKKTLMQGYFG